MSVAADTNFLLDLAEGDDDAWDAFETLRTRTSHLPVTAPPTVLHELAYLSEHEPSSRLRLVARRAMRSLVRIWHIHPAQLSSVQHGIVVQVGDRLRRTGLVPEEEKNDSHILAESALLNSMLLVTSDNALRGVEFARLTYELRNFDLPATVIVTPKEIIRKFFQ